MVHDFEIQFGKLIRKTGKGSENLISFHFLDLNNRSCPFEAFLY